MIDAIKNYYTSKINKIIAHTRILIVEEIIACIVYNAKDVVWWFFRHFFVISVAFSNIAIQRSKLAASNQEAFAFDFRENFALTNLFIWVCLYV